MFVISAIWLALGISNNIVLGYRITPLAAIDLKIMKSAFSMASVYFGPLQFVTLGIAVILSIGLLAYVYIKSPKLQRNIKKNIKLVFVVGVFTFFVTVVFIKTDIISDSFKNLSNAYKDYGFVYGFTSTVVNVGINKPDEYSEDTIGDIKENIADNKQETEQNKGETNNISQVDYEEKDTGPNIIFLQLESFVDVSYIEALKCSKEPLPVFEYLKNNYSHGFLTVPMIGSGTANTEFEILSGMSLDFFGPGEFPYTTILKESTCETICYNLKNTGYKCHAIHNNTATFYGRNDVFSQLGFDYFIPVEAMTGLEYTPSGWAKDKVLTGEILKCINSTENRDFVFAISVQGHGKYPTEKQEYPEGSIEVSGLEEELNNQMEYYVNQLNEMDKFLGELIDELEKIEEDTILVVYGDHFPAINISEEQLKNKNLFQTEYVIWDNMSLKKQDENLYTYQLAARVLEKVDMVNGTLTKYHINNMGKEDYMKELELLEHDMLYGEKLIYNGVNPFNATSIKIGLENTEIKSTIKRRTSTQIIGNGYTKWSKVFVNGKKVETEFKGTKILLLKDIILNKGDIIKVELVSDDGTVLAASGEYTVK